MLDRIVTSFARSRRLDEGEVYGVGALALAEAARQFRASAHLTFRHYAKTCIQGKLGRAFKRGGSLAVRVEDAMERAYFGVVGHQVLEVNLASDADEDLEKGMRAGSAEALAASYIASLLEGRQATPEEELLELEGRRVRVEELEAALAALHPHELEVIRAFYWEEKELKQVAEEIRAHENTAQNRHRRALTKLRERLVGRGS
jgi:RNA polymerase sigma factor (sigma-70 family)